MSSARHRPILIVEDSREDFAITLRALEKAEVPNPIFRCKDGLEALDYLNGIGPYVDAATAPRPAIILLDLNLPGMNGKELLKALKADINLNTIPVIMVTTSNNCLEIDQCYALGAAGFICKPIEPGQLVASFRNLSAYWFDTVVLPVGAPGAEE